MDSFFFNITDRKYQVSDIFRAKNEYLTRVDISNGLVFFKGVLSKKSQNIVLKNIDRMLIIVFVKKGSISIENYLTYTQEFVKEGEIALYGSSKQDMRIEIEKFQKSDIFILFIADFFLKRYLSLEKNAPIDFLYQKILKNISLELINKQAIDALSLYNIEKILNVSANDKMQSIRAEHHVMEFIIYRFSLLDIGVKGVGFEEVALASRAKEVLLQNFTKPPKVEDLAHLCATNASKLKKVFKKVYEITLYGYVQKLRLEEANMLLKNETLTIGEIAKKVGYKHQGHFTKLFVATYGVHPKALKCP